MVSSREKQVRREQERKDDRELRGKPRPRPPSEKGAGGSEAEIAAMTVGAIVRQGQHGDGGVSRPSSLKHGLAPRPHSKGKSQSPSRRAGRRKEGPGQARRAPSTMDFLMKMTRLPVAPSTRDHLMKMTRLPLCSFGGRRYISFPPAKSAGLLSLPYASGLSERLLRSRTLLRRRAELRKGGGVRVVTQKNIIIRVTRPSSLFSCSYCLSWQKNHVYCKAFC